MILEFYHQCDYSFELGKKYIPPNKRFSQGWYNLKTGTENGENEYIVSQWLDYCEIDFKPEMPYHASEGGGIGNSKKNIEFRPRKYAGNDDNLIKIKINGNWKENIIDSLIKAFIKMAEIYVQDGKIKCLKKMTRV